MTVTHSGDTVACEMLTETHMRRMTVLNAPVNARPVATCHLRWTTTGDTDMPTPTPPTEPTPLQRLIADYLHSHKGENYSSIARRGSAPGDEFPKSTVQALATRPYKRQTPQPDTIRKLAKGLETSERRVREAAAQSAGYEAGQAAHENPEIQLLISTVRDLDPERLEAVLRRAELLHREMLDEQKARRKRRKT